MTPKEPDPPPPASRTILQAMTWQELCQAGKLENLSLQMRIDAMRACLVAIARGVDHPSFAAARALSSDDDMHAAFRIARGLHK